MKASVTRSGGRSASRFNKTLLPAAVSFYRAEGLKLRGAGKWRSALCPFHDDHDPSLRVNTHTGAFRCMSCGMHGGDVLEFYRRQYGAGFIEAAKALGAWEAR